MDSTLVGPEEAGVWQKILHGPFARLYLLALVRWRRRPNPHAGNNHDGRGNCREGRRVHELSPQIEPDDSWLWPFGRCFLGSKIIQPMDCEFCEMVGAWFRRKGCKRPEGPLDLRVQFCGQITAGKQVSSVLCV